MQMVMVTFESGYALDLIVVEENAPHILILVQKICQQRRVLMAVLSLCGEFQCSGLPSRLE